MRSDQGVATNKLWSIVSNLSIGKSVAIVSRKLHHQSEQEKHKKNCNGFPSFSDRRREMTFPIEASSGDGYQD